MKDNARRKIPLSGRKYNWALGIAEQVYTCLGDTATDCLSLFVEGDYRRLVDIEMDYQIDDLELFRKRYAAVSLMSKYPFEIPGLDRAAVAIGKFRVAEDICASSNSRLAAFGHSPLGELDHYDVISLARKKIKRLLGSFSWDLAERHFGFGPGASTSLRRVHGDAFYKFRNKPDTTYQNAALAYSAIRRIPVWHEYLCLTYGDLRQETDFESFIFSIMNYVKGNCVTTVPKNAKTDRVIAIEPDMNMFVQRGIGGVIRNRLKRVGVNLDDQTLNQDLAFVASFQGNLATVDLSMASDSVSLEFVRLMLPSDWSDAIEHCRSQFGILPDGSVHLYRKVSSMGNGFTFELESLLFWALIASVLDVYGGLDRRLAVYGDDLIFPSQHMDYVRELLTYVGFTVNSEKSFWHGPFRESCGKHFFSGYDVTPFYIRKGVDSPQRIVSVANGLKLLASRPYGDWGLDSSLRPAYDFTVGKLNRDLRRILRGPRELGDAVLWSEWDAVRPRSANDGWEGWQVTIIYDSYPAKPAEGVPYLLRQLSTLERNNMQVRKWLHGVASRDGKPRLKKCVTQQWSGFGDWV